MKIPTSTSFVMAATASLALQSSARAIPPDSPDLSHVPPHSARAESSAQFSSGLEAHSDSHEASETNRRFRLRDTEAVDSVSTDSLDNILQTVSEEMNELGLKARAADKNTGNSAADSSAPPHSARQLPSNAGVPEPVSSFPGQAANGIIQDGASIQSAVVSTVGSAIPSPSLPAVGAPTPLPVSSPVPPTVPVNSSGLPDAAAGIVRRDGVPPLSGIPQVVQIPGVVSGIPSAVSGIPGAVSGIPGQAIGNTPVGGIVSNSPVNPDGTVQGVAGDVAGVTNSVPVPQVPDQVPTPAQSGSLQRRGDPDDDGDGTDENNAPSSPSSTIATPSSSPNSSPSTSPVVASTADGSATSMSNADSATPAPNTDADVKVDLPVNPTSALPVNPLNSIPTLGGQPTALPFNPVSAPVPVPVPVPTGGLPVSPPNAPISLPVSAPTGLPNAPSGLPVNANLPIPKRRALTRRDDPSDADELPSGFPAPSGPIQGDTPPLLVPRSITKEGICVGASTSADHPASATGTVSSGTGVPPVSGSISTATTATATSGTATSSTATSQPSRRRRFFRFGRDEIA